MAHQSFQDLDVWKRACRLSVTLYTELSACRDFALKDQMTRSAVSIASNIAEGAERGSPREFIRFLRIAKGSSAELRTQLFIASQAGILPEGVARDLRREAEHLSAMLQRLAVSVRTFPKT